MSSSLRKDLQTQKACPPGAGLASAARRAARGSRLRAGLCAALCGLLTTAALGGCNPLRTGIDDNGTDPTQMDPGDGPMIGAIKITPDRTDLTLNGQPQIAQFHASAMRAGDITEIGRAHV